MTASLDSTDSSPFDLADSRNYIERVPYEQFAELRRQGVVWLDEPRGGTGYWAVTRYRDCVEVNRDFERFSSARKTVYLWDLPPDELAQQQLMMINMDPPLHTRYRRLVNKGFTPRMVARLENQIHATADSIIDGVIEAGRADFVTDLVAALPLAVIADLLGVPPEDRYRVFDWTNQMVGSEDPEFGISADQATRAALELYDYASQLYAAKRLDSHADLMTVLTTVEVDGERLSDLELELFFLLLSVAGNETARNLMAGAMQAFFHHPDQWARLSADRSLLPSAVEEMLRFVSPVMHMRRQATTDTVLGGQKIAVNDKVVFFHISANRDETVFDGPDTFDIGREPNPHISFGAGGPHFCLGANLARLEVRVMFEHLLDRMPDLGPAGPAQRLQSNLINGIKHLPVTFTPGPRIGAKKQSSARFATST
jgi:cholest-4-en-3-one 26-monooxygenase